MLAEKLNEIFEQEIEQRCNELQQELTSTQEKLKKTQNELFKAEQINNKLQNSISQKEMFEVFKGLVNKDNFESFLGHFNLNRNKFSIDGMDSEEIPVWFRVLFRYYEDKDKVFTLMDLFNVEYPQWAKKYTMPYDYNEEELKLFANPQYERYITNGQIFNGNIGFFWRNVRTNQGDTKNILTSKHSFATAIPWQLILSNPLWSKPDVFATALKRLSKSYFTYFFAIQTYTTISEDQAAELAKHLPKREFLDVHKEFIKNNPNIIKNNEWLAEEFKDKINDNQFTSFYFLNYPIGMQKVFVKTYSKNYESKFNLVKKMTISKEEKIKLLMEIADRELA